MIKIHDFAITPYMLKAILELDEFKKDWKTVGKLSPERLAALKRIATIESIGSSTRIEGSKLSDDQVEELLANINTRSFRSRDEQEVAGYSFTCEAVLDSYEEMPLTENIIKQLHGWLLKYADKDQRHRGEYKKLSNSVEAFDESGYSLGDIFQTASPFETPMRMQELVHWTREALEEKILHPLLVIGIFVVIFLAIHPFQDGNGRLSRILTTLLLLRTGYVYMAYSSCESVIEGNKEGYYLALRRTQKTMQSDKIDWEPWLLFFLRSLVKQKRLLEQKIVKDKPV